MRLQAKPAEKSVDLMTINHSPHLSRESLKRARGIWVHLPSARVQMNEKPLKNLALAVLLTTGLGLCGLSLIQPQGNTAKLFYEIEALPGEGFQVELLVKGLDGGAGFKLLDG